MGNAVRINKDLLRTMLHFDKFTGINEGLTRDAARSLAKEFLSKDINVIIDDTNLNAGTMQGWKDLGKELGATIEVLNIDAEWQECVLRDSGRAKSVGKNVIFQMALRYGMVKKPEKGYVLCDIDGTIADTTHRLHYLEGEKRDWKGFFSMMKWDPLRVQTYRILNDLHDKGYKIIFVSARPEDYREVTEWWLKNQVPLPYMTLIMRKSGDKRDDDVIKAEILQTYFPDKSVIHCVIDDRPRVIRMWKSHGLEVIDVGKGIEF